MAATNGRRPSKPPATAELARAKWGIGGQAVWLQGGKVWGGSSRSPDAGTAAAIDRERKLLFLALGQYVSPRPVLQELANLGAKDGMLLDGGGGRSPAPGRAPGGGRDGVDVQRAGARGRWFRGRAV